MKWENPWDAYLEEPGGDDVLRIVRDNRMVITVERGPFDSSADLSETYQDACIADWFPVPGEMITCGNRTDLPKKQRRHDWVSLGVDTKNAGTLGIVEVDVFACVVCGKDKR